VGTHTATVTVRLTSYPSQPVSVTFKITIIDERCISTVISTVTASIENLVAFAGYKVSSKVKYPFNDTISISNPQTTDSKDLCGDKQLSFQLNGTSTSYLNGSSADFIYLSPPANTTDFGVALATV
jgi:hypothetical protein